jgi:hypothetical protein
MMGCGESAGIGRAKRIFVTDEDKTIQFIQQKQAEKATK